ncbi:unnamed protein product [Pedinophyceae sp. YPF-701]|nr:unnamed protein product [Pedinophyceae sp. YPF-701]
MAANLRRPPLAGQLAAPAVAPRASPVWRPSPPTAAHVDAHPGLAHCQIAPRAPVRPARERVVVARYSQDPAAQRWANSQAPDPQSPPSDLIYAIRHACENEYQWWRPIAECARDAHSAGAKGVVLVRAGFVRGDEVGNQHSARSASQPVPGAPFYFTCIWEPVFVSEIAIRATVSLFAEELRGRLRAMAPEEGANAFKTYEDIELCEATLSHFVRDIRAGSDESRRQWKRERHQANELAKRNYAEKIEQAHGADTRCTKCHEPCALFEFAPLTCTRQAQDIQLLSEVCRLTREDMVSILRHTEAYLLSLVRTGGTEMPRPTVFDLVGISNSSLLSLVTGETQAFRRHVKCRPRLKPEHRGSGLMGAMPLLLADKISEDMYEEPDEECALDSTDYADVDMAPLGAAEFDAYHWINPEPAPERDEVLDTYDDLDIDLGLDPTDDEDDGEESAALDPDAARTLRLRVARIEEAKAAKAAYKPAGGEIAYMVDGAIMSNRVPLKYRYWCTWGVVGTKLGGVKRA